MIDMSEGLAVGSNLHSIKATVHNLCVISFVLYINSSTRTASAVPTACK